VIKDKKFQIKKFLLLAFTIVSVFVRSFVPFIYLSYNEKSLEPIIQIFRRLFPFGRGLLHSYWAPNFWAIYSFFDKIMFHYNYSYLQTDASIKQQNSSSLGLTQITEFNILPNITSKTANIIVVFLALLLILKSLVWDKYHIELKHRNNQFIKYLTMSSLIFFNFGYQVHEKAFIKTSLLAIVYLFISSHNITDSLKASLSNVENNYRTFFYCFMNLVIFVGVFAQMPLIHSLKDYLIKFILVFLYLVASRLILNFLIKTNKKSNTSSTLNQIINGYAVISLIIDFIIVFSPHVDLTKFVDINNVNYNLLVTISNLKEKYQFFPLMIFSVINAIVVQIICVMIFFIKEDSDLSKSK
jgi:alpha-1,3-glucosyltransferase